VEQLEELLEEQLEEQLEELLEDLERRLQRSHLKPLRERLGVDPHLGPPGMGRAAGHPLLGCPLLF
jgi:hypothetical protein